MKHDYVWLAAIAYVCHMHHMFDDLKPPLSTPDCLKSNRPITEAIPHFVLKFQLDFACLDGGEASTNFLVLKVE